MRTSAEHITLTPANISRVPTRVYNKNITPRSPISKTWRCGRTEDFKVGLGGQRGRQGKQIVNVFPWISRIGNLIWSARKYAIFIFSRQVVNNKPPKAGP